MSAIKTCIHERRVCADCVIVTDAAKRAHDTVNSYASYIPWDQRLRSWVAIRLADGGSDGVLYESRQAAIRHQAHEQQCAYFSYRNAPNGFSSVKDAQLYLDYHRMAYDGGFRLPDPDEKENQAVELIMPTAMEQIQLQLDPWARKQNR